MISPKSEQESKPKQDNVQRAARGSKNSSSPPPSTAVPAYLQAKIADPRRVTQFGGEGADAEGAWGEDAAHRVAGAGLHGAATPLPHLDRIQSSFGRHDITGVLTQVGGDVRSANERLGSEAYTHDARIGFKQTPDLGLAAHEAAHVVQQRRGVQLKSGIGQPGDQYERHSDAVASKVVAGESAESLLDALPRESSNVPAVQAAPPTGLAGSPSGHVNPVLSPEEMFGIIQRQRAWNYSPGGGQMCIDPAGVGRGVGPAAGGRRAGFAVFSVIQVTDADGRPVALTYGEHLAYGEPHAEQRAVAALRREIPAMRDVSGGRMTVVLDQFPCPAGRQDCMGLLQRYANQRGLQLEIHVPEREAVGGGRTVSPRTAAMSSMRSDVPPFRLRQLGGPSGGAAPLAPAGAASAVPTVAAGPMRITAPRPASPSMMRAHASLILALERETARSVRLNARVTLIVRGVGGMLSALGMLATVSTINQMYAEGTLFPEVERQADQIDEYSREMEEWAIDTTNEISLMSVIAAISDATEREDADALFDIDDGLTNIYMQFDERAQTFEEYTRDFRARQQGLGVMSDFYLEMAGVPIGLVTTAPQVDALALHISLQRLEGRCGSIADHFGGAERQLRFYADFLRDAAYRANSNAWAMFWRRVAFATAQSEREREVSQDIRRQRRLNQIQNEIDAINAELEAPMCRMEEDLDYLRLQREWLLMERTSLEAGETVGGRE